MTDRPPILMVRMGARLASMGPIDAAALAKYPAGKALSVRVSRGRSSPQLRLYWSLLGKVAENLEGDVSDEDLHEWLKIKLNYTKPIIQRNGTIVEIPVSVALDKMEQHEFNRYFEHVKELLIESLIPGINSAALERAAREMLGTESTTTGSAPVKAGACVA